MARHSGGMRVGEGTYWSPKSFNLIHVKGEAVLPGDTESLYYRLPFLIVFFLGIALGGFYIVVFPVLVIATSVYVVGIKLLGGLLNQARRSVSFGWRPTEAYLAGKNRKEKKDREGKE